MRSCTEVALLAPPAVFCSSSRCSLLPGRLRRRSFVGAPCCTCRQSSTWSARERTGSSCSRRAAASCSPGRAGPRLSSHVARRGTLLPAASRTSPSRPRGDCRTPGAPSSETMSSRSMPTRRRVLFGSVGPDRQCDSSTSLLTPFLPVSPSTFSAGSAIASSSQRCRRQDHSLRNRLPRRPYGGGTRRTTCRRGHSRRPSRVRSVRRRPHRPRREQRAHPRLQSDRSRPASCQATRCRGRRHRRRRSRVRPQRVQPYRLCLLLRSRSPRITDRGNRQSAGAARNRSRASRRPSRRPRCSDRGRGNNDLGSLCTPLHRAPHWRRPRRYARRGAHHLRAGSATKLRGCRRAAAGVGFEPTGRLRAQRFSRPPDSTALAPRRAVSLCRFVPSGQSVISGIASAVRPRRSRARGE